MNRLWAIALLLPGIASAHPLAPSLLEWRELGQRRFEIHWKQPLAQPVGVELLPQLPPACRALDEPRSSLDSVSASLRWTVECDDDWVRQALSIEGLEPSAGTVLIRWIFADGRTASAVLDAQHPSVRVPERISSARLFGSYVRLGVDHLLTGLDHVLFVVGLALLAGTSRQLISSVTAFTLGHSLTLGLAVLGYVAMPVALIELLIAASVLSLSMRVASQAEPESTRRLSARALIFGLFHGLGFAGALTDAGLPPTDIPLALFSFNLGIELGQIAVVIAVAALQWMARRWLVRPWLAQAMGALAAFWCFERAAALLGRR